MQALRGLFGGLSANDEGVAARLRELSRPLREPGDLEPLMGRIGDARYVLLGEATHGTSEYYTWRMRISQRLIQEKGFSFIAVEGDWPDCYRVNRYVKAAPDSGSSAHAVLNAYERWPTWMWANREIVRLAEWLRGHNDRQPAEQKVGFFGIDVYSLWDSMEAVVKYLERVDPELAHSARRAYACFDPYEQDEQEYARATMWVPDTCEDEAVAMLRELRGKAPEYQDNEREAFFNAEQNALIAKNAELYYRTMVRGGAASWNVRDTHMVDTLDRLMQFHGPDAKAIVWEHNTHIGDARATDMARSGMVNVGQLVRDRHGDEGVVIAGFGSHRGSVIAAPEWGAQMQRMRVPEAREGSYEDLMHRVGQETGQPDQLFVFAGAEAEEALRSPRGHRAIGVVYHPEYESYGNYVPTVLARRYDAFLFIDETKALQPLHLEPEVRQAEVPETYPSGM